MADGFDINVALQLQLPKGQLAQIRRQIETSLGKSKAFDINTSGLKKADTQVRKLADTQKRATQTATSFGEAVALKGENFAAYTVATIAITKLTSVIAKGTREAIKFEAELAKIAQTTNRSNSEIQRYSNQILEISKNYGVSQTKIAETVRVLAQSGLAFDKSLKAAERLAKTTLLATFDNLSSTTESLIALIASFELSVNDAGDALEAINSVSKRFAVEANDIVEAIKRTGGAFKSAGGDINELIALFTSVRATSRESAETIATSFRTIFGRLQRPKTIEFFKDLNIQLVDLEGNFVGPFKAIQNISRGLEEAGIRAGSIEFARVAEQIGGIRQLSKVIPLLTQFEKTQKALAVANAGVAESDADVIKAKETLAQKIAELQANFSSLISEIFKTEDFQKFANALIDISNAALELTRSLKDLVPIIALLGGIKLGQGLARGLKGFSATKAGAGSGSVGLNSGGMVPGSGNSDTVPAMLTPGEFVIRKDSVKAIGADRLARMNKYAGGGVIKKVKDFKEGEAYVVPPNFTYNKDKNDEFVRNSGGKKSRNSFNTQDEFAYNEIVKKVDVDKLTKIDKSTKAQYEKGGIKRGKAFEKIIASNYGVQLAEKSDGSGKSAQTSRVDGLRGNTPVEIKSTKESQSGLISSKMIGGALNPRSSADEILSAKLKKEELRKTKDTINLGRVILFQDITKGLGAESEKQKAVEPRVSKGRKGRNSGGPISGQDTVPSLLTPGEFVFNKESAQKIGYSNLNKMNKDGVAGFNKGGAVGVQRFQDGGGVSSNVSSFIDFAQFAILFQIVQSGLPILKNFWKGLTDAGQQIQKSRKKREKLNTLLDKNAESLEKQKVKRESLNAELERSKGERKRQFGTAIKAGERTLGGDTNLGDKGSIKLPGDKALRKAYLNVTEEYKNDVKATRNINAIKRRFGQGTRASANAIVAYGQTLKQAESANIKSIQAIQKDQKATEELIKAKQKRAKDLNKTRGQGGFGNKVKGFGNKVKSFVAERGATIALTATAAAASFVSKRFNELSIAADKAAEAAIKDGNVSTAVAKTKEKVDAKRRGTEIKTTAAAGAASGAIAGAYIGTFFGPIVGTAIGAALGGAVGGIAGALAGASKKVGSFTTSVTDYLGFTNSAAEKAREVEQARIAAIKNAIAIEQQKSAAEVKNIRERIKAGKATSADIARAQISSIKKQQKIFADNQLKTGSDEGKQNLESQAKSFESLFEEIKQAAEKGPINPALFREYQKAIKLVRASNAITQDRIVGQNVELQLIQEKRKENEAIERDRIKELKKTIAAQNEYTALLTKSSNAQLIAFKSIRNLSQSLQLLSGEIQSVSIQFGQALKPEEFESKGFQKTLDDVSKLGPEAKRQVDELRNAKKAQKDFNDLLASGVKDEDKLKEALTGADVDPERIERTFKILKDAAKGKDKIKAWQKALEESRKIVEESTSKRIASIEKLRSNEEETLRSRQNLINQEIGIRNRYIEVSKESIKATREFNDRLSGRELSFSDILGRQRTDASQTAATAGVNIAGLPIDDQLRKLSSEILKTQKQFSKLQKTGKVEERENTRNKLNTLKKSFEELTNTSDLLAAAEKKRSEILSRKELASELTFGGTQKRSQFKQTFAAAQFLGRGGSAQRLNEKTRADVFQFLQRFRKSNIFGGTTGQQIIDRETRQALIASGFAPDKVDELIQASVPIEIKQLDTLVDIKEELKKGLLRSAKTLNDQDRNDFEAELSQANSSGGLVYANKGGSIFKPRGTDTVPAMLTPGEFVVRKSAVDKIGADNLAALNNGGKVVYKQDGGKIDRSSIKESIIDQRRKNKFGRGASKVSKQDIDDEVQRIKDKIESKEAELDRLEKIMDTVDSRKANISKLEMEKKKIEPLKQNVESEGSISRMTEIINGLESRNFNQEKHVFADNEKRKFSVESKNGLLEYLGLFNFRSKSGSLSDEEANIANSEGFKRLLFWGDSWNKALPKTQKEGFWTSPGSKPTIENYFKIDDMFESEIEGNIQVFKDLKKIDDDYISAKNAEINSEINKKNLEIKAKHDAIDEKIKKAKEQFNQLKPRDTEQKLNKLYNEKFALNAKLDPDPDMQAERRKEETGREEKARREKYDEMDLDDKTAYDASRRKVYNAIGLNTEDEGYFENSQMEDQRKKKRTDAKNANKARIDSVKSGIINSTPKRADGGRSRKDIQSSVEKAREQRRKERGQETVQARIDEQEQNFNFERLGVLSRKSLAFLDRDIKTSTSSIFGGKITTEQVGLLQTLEGKLQEFIENKLKKGNKDILSQYQALQAEYIQIIKNPKEQIKKNKESKESLETVATKSSGGLVYANKGGSIFKPRGADTVPAMLTPGEFVMRPEAVNKYGGGFMKQLNKGKIPGFRKGGMVYRQDGGPASGGASSGGGMDMSEEINKLSAAFASFGEFVNKFAEIPTDFTMSIAPVQVTLSLVGADVLSAIGPGLREMVVQLIQGQIPNITNQVTQRQKGGF